MAAQKTITNFIPDYLRHLETDKKRSPKTLENYSHYLDRFASWLKNKYGEIIPPKLNAGITGEYRKWLHNLNRRKSSPEAALSRQTQNYHLIALRGFVKYLSGRKLLAFPVKEIRLAKQPARQIPRLRTKEIKRLLEAPQGESLRELRDKAILELLADSGLKISELVGLTRPDADYGKNAICVSKKGRRQRLLPLAPETKKTLRAYLRKRSDPSSALFVRIPRNISGKIQITRLTPRSVQRIVKKYAQKAGIAEDTTPQTLRCSCAVNLFKKGLRPQQIQTFLGHSHLNTTKKIL